MYNALSADKRIYLKDINKEILTIKEMLRSVITSEEEGT